MSNLSNTRKIINKYSNSDEDIKNYSFSDGEIVISTLKNNEGIYIKNEEDALVKIGEIDNSRVEALVNEIMAESGVPKHQDLSESDYKTLINEGKVTIKNDNGEDVEVIYDENVYYMIYEDDEVEE
jgi:hypothetical protein